MVVPNRERAADLDRLSAPGEGFIWVHLDLTDVRSRGLIEKFGVLTADTRETLTGPIDHQFLEHSEALVSGAFVDHERGLAGRLSQTDYLRFAFGQSFLISARRRPLNSTEATRVALSAGSVAPTPLSLFEAIVDQLCDELSRIIAELSATLDRIEERIIIEGSGRDERAMLGPARRSAVRIARQISGLRSTLLRLETAAEEPEHAELLDAASRLGQRTEALGHDIASVQDRARLLQDELNAILNLETNDRLYVLTVVTTLLLPATFVTGFFGMNTKGLLFGDNEDGTLYATLLCLMASMAVLFFMRRMGLTRQTDANVDLEKKSLTNPIPGIFQTRAL